MTIKENLLMLITMKDVYEYDPRMSDLEIKESLDFAISTIMQSLYEEYTILRESVPVIEKLYETPKMAEIKESIKGVLSARMDAIAEAIRTKCNYMSTENSQEK